MNTIRQAASAASSACRYSRAGPLYVSTPISAALSRITPKTARPKAEASVSARHRAASSTRPRRAGIGTLILLLVRVFAAGPRPAGRGGRSY
ncbi:hypothetical protein ACIPUC_24825 [Streptomyces sp. LARHCF249]